MTALTRKSFLCHTGWLAAGFAMQPFLRLPKEKWQLSFSTLGCPDWTFPQIVAFAAKHGYQGLEIRGIQRQMDLPASPVFNTAESRASTLALMKKNNLRIVGLGASTNLHLPMGEERSKNLAEAKRFIDLAEQIHCPYVRVFPNNFPKEKENAETIELIVSGLAELADYAAQKNVMVLMETHGDVVWTKDLETIMQRVNRNHVGLIWDIANMWTVTKEPPAEVYAALKKYIRHTHIKDALLNDGKIAYTLLGRGDVPIFQAIDVLVQNGYAGFYSFEWEKLWHPEIAEPEIAIADYPKAIKAHRR